MRLAAHALVGTAIAVATAPVCVALRKQSGAIELAIASSAAIMIYVMVLGWLRRRRFEREAIARGTTLEGAQGMLQTALRLAASALVATGLGLLARAQLLQWLPDADAATVLGRATLLCMFGLCIYAAMARLLRVNEVSKVQLLLLRKLRPGRQTSLTVSSDNSNAVAP